MTSICRNSRLMLTNGPSLYHLDALETFESMIQHLIEKHNFMDRNMEKKDMINVRLVVVKNNMSY